MELEPGFKLSEAGPIPEDWEAVLLGQYGHFRSGDGFPLSYQDQGGELPFYKVGDLDGDGLSLAEPRQWISDAARRKLRARLFTSGAIVFAKVGAAISLERKRLLQRSACLDNNLMALLCDAQQAIPRFAHAALSRVELFEHAATTSVPSLSGRVIGQIPIPTPPLSEQRAVAAAVANFDAWIAETEAEASKLASVKAAAMDALLAPTVRLPGFTEGWESVRLGDRGTFRKGRGITRAEVRTTGLPAIRYGELYTRFDSHILEIHSYISPESTDDALRIRFGDICFAASGETADEIGKCAALMLDGPCFAGGDIIVLSPDRDDPTFLGYLLNTPRIAERKAKLGQGDTVVHIHSSKLAELEIELPDIAEQRAIAAVLSDIDSALTAARAVVAKARGVKAAAMEALLSGRVRLPSIDRAARRAPSDA